MAQKLYIPNLGTLMILAEDWTFKLYFERRNTTLLQAVVPTLQKGYYWRGIDASNFEDDKLPSIIEYEPALTPEELAQSYKSYQATNSRDVPFVRVTLPKGTQLKVDRIYIRAGSESFSSVTFRTTKNCPEKRFTGKRFWAKLREVNTIVADIIG